MSQLNSPFPAKSPSIKIHRWQTPPEARKGTFSNKQRRPPREDYLIVAQALRERPKEWAVIVEGEESAVKHIVHSIKYGVIHAFRPAGIYEATSRSVGNQIAVFARYLGDEEMF